MNKVRQAFEKIDEINKKDPNLEAFNGQNYPKEFLYSQRMLATLALFNPNASEALQIACYAQHIGRWNIARTDYPMDKAGYKTWRKDLAVYHSEQTGHILKALDYDDSFITTVSNMLQKKRLKLDEDTQTLEDVICLVFLQYYLDDFAKSQDMEKMITILQKTWHKMSDRGRLSAELMLPSLSVDSKKLLTIALTG